MTTTRINRLTDVIVSTTALLTLFLTTLDDLWAADMPEEKPVYKICQTDDVSPSFDSYADSVEYDRSFRHRRSRLLAKTGRPRHFAHDMLGRPGHTATLKAKFSYGVVSKDLEDEPVEVWLFTCDSGYTRLGTGITDHDGRIHFELGADNMPPVGTYTVYYRVPADGTGVKGDLRVVPDGTRFAVFDIDETISSGGTMTTVWNVVTGDLDELPRPAAVETAQRRYEQGYQLVYLTARPYIVTDHTREWLDAFGFPPGIMRLVYDTSETLISRKGRGQYKERYMQSLLDQGFEIDVAYGNAESDIRAYRGVNLAPESTFILGEHGGTNETIDLGDSFEKHLESLGDLSEIEQPYVPAAEQKGKE